MKVIATGTTERPLTIIKDNDGHTYVIPVDEEDRFRRWVEYMEGFLEEWEGHEYDSIGCHISCLRIVGMVSL